MLSAVFMFRRFLEAIRFAAREEGFRAIAGAAVVLVAVGTTTFSLGQHWSVIDAFYFAIATLTTSSVADPALVIKDGWTKIFVVFYILVGIGLLVELARQVGFGFVRTRGGREEAKPAPRGRH